MRRSVALTLAAALAAALSAPAAVAAETPKLSGLITSDGSSTVGPYTAAAAEGFQRLQSKVRITVGISGTGGGFQRFCRGETDLSNASRPIKQSEAQECLKNEVRYIAVTVANDGLSVVVNRDNTWADCLTVPELKAIWQPGSKIENWQDVRPGFPDVSLKLFGAGTDSGTFDFFTEAINGKSRASRSDYLATEDDNVTVNGVGGEKGGLGYFGFSYYEENQDKLKVLKIDGGKGQGCVAPSAATVQAGTYKPLGRPLFVYVKRTSLQRAEVRGFLKHILDNERTIAGQARFISLTGKQLAKARNQYRLALAKLGLKA